MIKTQRESAHSADATLLIGEAVQELRRRYPGFEANEYAASEADQTGAAFVIARLDGVPVGCGALRPFETADSVEIKRMFVRDAYRRQGISRQILAFLEQTARELGYQKIVLETGTKQPEAIQLYHVSGYHRIPNFGEITDETICVCFAKEL
ncbi:MULTISPECIES: GNAT family N-acetyltransferase [unclassified Siphonobacter]|uniref:GNAT family N-acetyltransferase n=1 Tax=unclassified Siphonobacter TaxID=2635712 RepID=UPI0027806B34|nr:MULTISPECIES: GNAT family N-acetyltransferase [unclassified Siphonobacter]MDQ1088299.1 putative acetyltransferase [Siphonobacter sp. SORGH_AS_1065]MDR6194440.1 putative acetyltransferase [Siphonobacter sp. SORGH_AS_0500]